METTGPEVGRGYVSMRVEAIDNSISMLGLVSMVVSLLSITMAFGGKDIRKMCHSVIDELFLFALTFEAIETQKRKRRGFQAKNYFHVLSLVFQQKLFRHEFALKNKLTNWSPLNSK